MATIAELLDLAARYHQSGNLQQAEALYGQILHADPGHAMAHHLLGLLAHQAGRSDTAIALIRKAIALDPADVECHFNLGAVLMNQGRPAEAAECYREVVQRDPRHAQAHNNLGIILKQQGQLAEAVACYRHALHCNPDHASAHNNLGNALMEQGQWAEAIASYRQALRINPHLADACINLGNALKDQEEFAEAASSYRQALRIIPRHADAHYSLSIVLTRLGLFQDAREHVDQALEINPDHARAQWQRSLLRLLDGDFAGGWQGYEQRWALPNVAPRSLPQPRWGGSSLEGKTILVHAEQGLGDTIQFARYLPMVKERGGTVLFECQPSLLQLVSGMAGIDQLIPAGAALPPFDVHVPLLDLPSVFGTTVATIPAAVPYLHADAGRLLHWRQEFEGLPGFKVGIVWQGNPKNTGDRYRSVSLTHFASLADVPGITLLSLQVGPGVEQLARAAFPVIDLGNRFDPGSLDDLAAVLKHVHLVITVDTAVAHLAGALAIPTWVLIPVTPDWRWLRERTDSPWYPTIRLFRRSRSGAWDEVFERVREELLLKCRAAWHFNMGIIHMRQGQPAEAIESYRQALRIKPDHAQAHNNLGNALKSQGQPAEAVECYRQALRCDPRNAHAHYNLGNALKDQGQMADAAQCYRQALAVNPRHAEAHNNLGVILKDQGQPTEAAECFRRALVVSPDDANTHYNLGSVLKDHEQFAEAALCYRQVLRITPQHADAHHNLSIALTRVGLLEEALVHIEQTLRINPGQATALWQRSLLRLLMGDFTGGWQDFEERWTQPNVAARPLPRPRWDGSSLEGKTILVYAEQGLGDTIHFARYLPMVKARGGTVLFECQPSLARLLAGVAGADRLIPGGAPLPPYDVQVPLLSLPALFGTTLATIPAAVPYLYADPGLLEYWRRELAPVKDFKIGIAWQGSIDHPGDRYRSIPLTRFEILAQVPGTRLVSVQKGPGTEQLLTGAFPIFDPGDRLETFRDTAAVLMNLDLVITVDSAVAHLAGALGVPVWVLLPFTPDWRWLLERSDSPWYPTMRLFRQRRFGDWEDVFERVAANLPAHGEIAN